MKKVLFVCLGNICRSPLAEAVFNDRVKELGWIGDSAGTAAYHIGEQPDNRSIKVALGHGIPISHNAKQFEVQDFDHFDYVIAMDQNNYNDMKSLLKGGSVDNLFLLREFDPENTDSMDVPDPYYGGEDGFEKVYDMIERSMEPLIDHIKSNS